MLYENVKVYWNIRKKCWSILSKGIVVAYANAILMKNVIFKVNKKGRERVLKDKRKNVHAFAKGNIISLNDNNTLFNINKEINYNPYRFDYFYSKQTLEKIENAELVYLINGKVFEL